MKTTASPYKPVRTARDCDDWLTAEDVIKHALAAFYALCRHQDKAEADFGGASAFNGQTDRASFADDLAEIFLAKLHDQGFKRNVPGFAGWASETHAWWAADTLSTNSQANSLDIHRRAS